MGEPRLEPGAESRGGNIDFWNEDPVTFDYCNSKLVDPSLELGIRELVDNVDWFIEKVLIFLK